MVPNPIKMNDLGVFPYFWKHPYSLNTSPQNCQGLKSVHLQWKPVAIFGSRVAVGCHVPTMRCEVERCPFEKQRQYKDCPSNSKPIWNKFQNSKVLSIFKWFFAKDCSILLTIVLEMYDIFSVLSFLPHPRCNLGADLPANVPSPQRKWHDQSWWNSDFFRWGSC